MSVSVKLLEDLEDAMDAGLDCFWDVWNNWVPRSGYTGFRMYSGHRLLPVVFECLGSEKEVEDKVELTTVTMPIGSMEELWIQRRCNSLRIRKLPTFSDGSKEALGDFWRACFLDSEET